MSSSQITSEQNGVRISVSISALEENSSSDDADDRTMVDAEDFEPLGFPPANKVESLPLVQDNGQLEGKIKLSKEQQHVLDLVRNGQR